MVSTIGIVSLSSGIIGEDFVKHEVDLGIQRLKDLGLNPIFLPHSLKGLDFIKEHPEARAEDLIHAFSINPLAKSGGYSILLSAR